LYSGTGINREMHE
jgi:hypothetical protein